MWLLVLLFLSIFVQLIYWVNILLQALFYKKGKIPIYEKSFSVIICAHNEYRNLVQLIPKLLQQAYSHFEIIVVNDRSTDFTKSYLEKISSTHSQFKYININETPQGFNEKKYALSRGIQFAEFDYLLLTDADCYPKSTHWISEINKAYWNKNIKIVLGFSPYKEEIGFLNVCIRFETLMTAMQYLSMALLGQPYMGVGRNISYKKELFLENNGLEHVKNIVGGDDDLFINKVANSRNTAVALDSKSHMVSFSRRRWKDWILQKRRHLSVGNYYSFKTKCVLFMFIFSYGLSYILLLFTFSDYPLTSSTCYTLRIAIVGCTAFFWKKKAERKN